MKKTIGVYIIAACMATALAGASLRLTYPGGEDLCLGQTCRIEWTATGITSKVKLQLIRPGGGLVGLIVNDLDADDSPYSWTIGEYIGGTASAGETYQIRISAKDGSANAESATAFLIKSCAPVLTVRRREPGLRHISSGLSATTVRVTNPNTYGVLTHGDEVTVTWEHINARPGQRLKVFARRYTARCHQETGFNLLIPLGSLPIEAGHLNWDVSPTFYPHHTYSIRLEPEVPGDFAADESDECFEVRSRTTIRVLEPNGGEIYGRGSPIPIRLQMTHFEPGFMWVNVYLWRYDDACSSAIEGTSCNRFESNSTECTCLINSDLPPGKYKIHLTVNAGEEIHPSGTDPLARYAYDSSDACFTIR